MAFTGVNLKMCQQIMKESRVAKLIEFLDADPGDSFSRFALALEHLTSGDTDTACTHFEYIQANDPEYVGVYYHLGKLYQQTGDPHKALATFTSGIAVARKARDHHSASELEQALSELEDE